MGVEQDQKAVRDAYKGDSAEVFPESARCIDMHCRVNSHFFRLKEMPDGKRSKVGCMVVFQASGGFVRNNLKFVDRRDVGALGARTNALRKSAS